MIDKEISEIIDALTRETGESMLPYQELEILGFTPLGESNNFIRRKFVNSDDDDDEILPSETEEEDGVEYNDYNTDDDGYIDEEYEFDEDDEEYTLLTKVLRLNNCRKKYFA